METRTWPARLLRAPALHMVVLGAVLFGALQLAGGGEAAGERQRVVVAPHQLELTVQEFVQDSGRLPTDSEREQMVEMLIDDEILYQYALVHGMHQHPTVEARLARIAAFVEAEPHHARSDAERAAAAVDLGLHHGDLVVRRIMVDSARRLIRSVSLLQEPPPEALEAYVDEHRDELLAPTVTRISHVAINGFKWPDSAARGRELLARIEAGSLDVDGALALGDEGIVDPHLPPLTEQALGTRMGTGFARQVVALPAGGWHGPLESRHGHHLVWVHERSDGALPPWEQIAPTVEDRVRQQLADEWLERRLLELRDEFEIVAPGRPS